MVERCYLHHLRYYPSCTNCDGRNPRKMCYKTEEQVEEHLKGFSDLFNCDNGRLEEAIERLEMLNGQGEIW